MLPRERVITTIKHLRPDRVPLYGWVRANLEKQIAERFGSADAFEDHYEFDLAHLFGGPYPYWGNVTTELRARHNGTIEPSHLLEIELPDPDDPAPYEDIKNGIRHHKEQRGRFVYVQTPGIFEILNDPFTIQNHLLYLLMYEDDLHKVYERQARWNLKFAMNCLDLGVDMIHVSDDWGGQNTLLFDPQLWRRLIYPYHKITCDAVKKRGAFLSLHSDGNISQALDGIVDLGYDVLHPCQESAGVDLTSFKNNYGARLTMMGGLDVQMTLGFGRLDAVKAEIERVMGMFRNGGLIFCTSHFVQDHCTIEELTFAFDCAYKAARGK